MDWQGEKIETEDWLENWMLTSTAQTFNYRTSAVVHSQLFIAANPRSSYDNTGTHNSVLHYRNVCNFVLLVTQTIRCSKTSDTSV
jgi:hypothetical protein